jgi:hypothetical protein
MKSGTGFWAGWGGAILFILAAGLSAAGGQGEGKDRILEGWKAWQRIQSEIDSLSFSLSAGYSGDSSAARHVDKFDFGAGLAKGGYPDEFHFDFSSSNQLRRYLTTGGSSVENFITLQASYERHLLPFFKAFGFLERFSDTYLGIQQRYEAGIGIKGEAEIGLTRAGREKVEAVQDFRSALDGSRRGSAPASGLPAEALGVDEAKMLRTLTALKKRHAVLALGLIVTVLAEVERAEIELGDGSKRTLDPSRRFRLTLRPGLTWIMTEGLSLKWKTYFKLPVFGSIRAPAFDGRSLYDLRSDTFVTLRYDLPGAPSWARKISLIAEYKYFFDNAPPFVPSLQAAPRDHNSIVFKLGAEF